MKSQTGGKKKRKRVSVASLTRCGMGHPQRAQGKPAYLCHPLPASSGSGFQTSALRFCSINLHPGQTRAEAEVGAEREWEQGHGAHEGVGLAPAFHILPEVAGHPPRCTDPRPCVAPPGRRLLRALEGQRTLQTRLVTPVPHKFQRSPTLPPAP